MIGIELPRQRTADQIARMHSLIRAFIVEI